MAHSHTTVGVDVGDAFVRNVDEQHGDCDNDAGFDNTDVGCVACK